LDRGLVEQKAKVLLRFGIGVYWALNVRERVSRGCACCIKRALHGWRRHRPSAAVCSGFGKLWPVLPSVVVGEERL